jgi:hypothetical protein
MSYTYIALVVCFDYSVFLVLIGYIEIDRFRAYISVIYASITYGLCFYSTNSCFYIYMLPMCLYAFLWSSTIVI